MAEKNLHDIKIDELDSSKKTPLKNILTLLALLFIILVISVVITKLILNTDEGQDINESVSKSKIATEIGAEANQSGSLLTNGALATTAAVATTAAAIPTIKHVLERNLTSRIKNPLRTHETVKHVKEVKKLKEVQEVKKKVKSYKTPKYAQVHRSTPKATKHTATKHTTSSSTKHATTRHSSTPKKEYIDKVIVRKAPKSSSHSRSKNSKNKSFFGGKQKKLSNSYYIKVGTYKTPNTIISKIKKINYNYSVQKINNGQMARVYVGPFFSQNQAEANLAKVKKSVLRDAFVQKVRP